MRAYLRELIDRWRHPGEYQRQRIRRRYLEGVRMAERDRARFPDARFDRPSDVER
jgi:hypothetical protein